MVALDLESGLPIVLVLVLLLFGGAKIPQLARSLGKAKGEFSRGLAEGDDEKT